MTVLAWTCQRHVPCLYRQRHQCRLHAPQWSRCPRGQPARAQQEQQQQSTSSSSSVNEDASEDEEEDEGDPPPLVSFQVTGFSPDRLLIFLYKAAVRIVVYSTAIVLGMGSSSIMQVWIRAAVFMTVVMGLCIRDTWAFWEKVRGHCDCSVDTELQSVQQAKTRCTARGDAGRMHRAVCGCQRPCSRLDQRASAGNHRCDALSDVYVLSHAPAKATR